MSLLGGLISGGLGLLGSSMDATAQDNLDDQAWDRTKKTLTNQVQWRVQDAIKAGIHPLAALGLNPASGPTAGNIGGGTAGALAGAGSEIGDSLTRMASPEDKVAAQATMLSLERGKLENDLLRDQIASNRVRTAQSMLPGVSGAKVDADGNVYPDNSLVPGDNKMGSKVVRFGPLPGFTDKTADWVVGQPGSAQQIADNYGDIAQEVYGMYRLAVDAWANAYKPENDSWPAVSRIGQSLYNNDYFGSTPDAADYRW